MYFCFILRFSLIDNLLNAHKKTQSRRQAISKKIREWLYQFPKSVWWIINNQIADYCRISSQEKQHATSILGRFLPHNEIFLECSLGKWVKMQMYCACHCVLHLIHCIYCLLVMFLVLFCLHSRNQHHMWTCLTGLGNSRGWQLFILHTHNVSVLWSCVSAWVHTDTCVCERVQADVWECLYSYFWLCVSTLRVRVSTLRVRVSRCKFFLSVCE